MTLERDNPIQWYVYYSDANGDQRMPYWTREDAINGALFLHSHRLDTTVRYVKSSDGQCISFDEILASNSEGKA